MKKRTVAVAATLLSLGLVAGSVSAAEAAPAKSAVSLGITSTKSPTAGSYITFSGKTSKNLSKTKIYLQRKAQGKSSWSNVGSTTASTKLTYAFKSRSTGVGKYYYRAVGAGTSKVARSASSASSVTVYAYYYLSTLPSPSNNYSHGLIQVGGTNYSRSIWSGYSYMTGTRTQSFNASYRCKTFDATIGISDDSATSEASFSYDDGNGPVDLGTMTNGRGRHVTVDTRGIFRLTLVSAGTTYTRFNTVWGNARFLCSGKP